MLDGSGEVHPLPHALYVALVRGQASAETLAGQILRLADWYVRMKDGTPDTVVNETYTQVRFDSQGRVDWTNASSAIVGKSGQGSASEEAAWPSVLERERMQAVLLGTTE